MVAVYVKGKSPNRVTHDKYVCIMDRHFDHIDTLNDIADVLQYARDICRGVGVIRMSYHVTPLFAEPNALTTAVYADGFSKEWLALYDTQEFRQSDPIPSRVMAFGAPMTWREAIESGQNTPENKAYFEAMREYGLIYGFGLPLFGPGGRDAYAGIDFGKHVSEIDREALATVRAVAQAAHQRICWITDQMTEKPALSERELEVLTWAARGKTTQAIATILDLSPDTVKTYSKRIYAKLDASERVGAVLKALRLGLVKV